MWPVATRTRRGSRGGPDGARARRKTAVATPRASLAALAILVLPGTGPARAGDPAVRAILFGSLDAGPSAFASVGVKAAPERVDREGWAGLAVAGGGLRLERGGGGVPVLARATGLVAALGGYQFFRDWGVVGLFAGPEGAFETLIGVSGVRMLPARFGLRLQGEVWARPSERTLATATLILGSARADAYGRVSFGWRLGEAYYGPEAAAYADRTGYARGALGIHATGVRVGAFTLRLSGGCAYEAETRRLSPYLSMAGWVSL